jgi:uncharacterized protein with von Willebrand factor type A (vWA) domain
MTNELQKQLLQREEQLSLRKGDIATREADERAITTTCMVIDAEHTQVEANVQKYREELKV